MKPEQFLSDFEVFVNASNGMNQLRELILDLGMRGLIVSNSSKENEFKTFESSESLWKIPESWVWVEFSDVADFSTGKTPSTKNSEYWTDTAHGFPWISIGDMVNGGMTSKTKKMVTEKAVAEVFTKEPVPAGTILMSFKLTIGKITKTAMDTFYNEAIISINPHSLIDDYLFIFLPSLANFGQTVSAVKGNTLNKKTLAKLLIPLPPLEEQERIVARVEELMELCDQWEEERQVSTDLGDELRVSTPRHLVEAEKPKQVKDHFEVLVSEAENLFTKPEDVDDLRNLILNLAMRGKLSDLNATPISHDVLESALEELEKNLSQEKMIQAFRSIDSDEVPFSIPDHWVWRRLASISFYKGRATIKADDIHEDSWVLDLEDIEKKTSKLLNKVLRKERKGKSNRSEFQAGDVLYGRLRPYLSKVLVAHESGFCGGEIIPIVPLSCVLPEWLKLCLMREDFVSLATVLSKGINLPRFPTKDAEKSIHPLPPLEEQKLIVARVDELMELCDQLEEQLLLRTQLSEEYVLSSSHVITV